MTEQSPQAPATRGLRSDQFSGLLLIALALYIGWANLEYPVGSLSQPGPGYMPLLLAIFLGAMGLLIAFWGGRSRLLRDVHWPEATRATIILIACGVGAFALERIGYRLTVIALMIFFAGVMERKKPLPVLLVSVGFGFISFYVVADLLDVPLPRSPWGF
jgi:putative tricarboxylic transport membrane protein